MQSVFLISMTDTIQQLAREEQQHRLGLVRLGGQVEYRAQGRALSWLGSKVISMAWERAQETVIRPAGKHGCVAHCLTNEEIVKECALWTLSYIVGNVSDSRVKYKMSAFIGQRCEWIAFLRDPKVRDSWHLTDTAAHNFMDLGMANTMKLLQRRQSLGVGWQPLDQIQRVALGYFYLDTCVEATGWFDYKCSWDGSRKASLIAPNEGYRQYLRDYARVLKTISRPLHAPMLVPPVPFSAYYLSPSPGCGLDTVVNPDELFHKPGYLSLRTSTSSVAMEVFPDHVRKTKPYVWDALNKLQETEVVLDPHALRIVREAWNTGKRIGGMPDRDPLPLPVHTGNDRNHERAMFLYRKDHRSDVERSRVICFLGAAAEVENSSLYFPVHLDHRGRVYTRGSHINYHASDWQRQSLDFAERSPVKPHEVELRDEIDAAAGVPMEVQRILAIGNEPMGCTNLWRHTKSPWRLMKLCHEFTCYAANPGYTTGCPFPLDQTTSGFGHLAMLTRDAELARLSNCTGTSGSGKSDIYMAVSDEAKAINERRIYNGEGKEFQAAMWCRVNWPPRSVIKRIVMPAIYGMTFRTIMEIVREHVTMSMDRQVIMDGLRSSDVVVYLSRLLHEVIKRQLPAVRNLTQWLKVIGKEVLKLGTPMHWYSPSGFKVQSFMGERGRADIRLIISGRSVSLRPLVTDDGNYKLKPTVGRQVGADFIHSYDAAFLHYAVSQWSGDSMLCAHDSFAVPLGQRAKLKRHLNECWVRFYETDYLTQLHGYATMLTGASLPAPPIVGDLDMSTVGMSDHLFA